MGKKLPSPCTSRTGKYLRTLFDTETLLGQINVPGRPTLCMHINFVPAAPVTQK